VFHALHGGYFLRLYDLSYQLRLHGRFSAMVRRYLLAHDRAHMTRAEIQESLRRQKAAAPKIIVLTLPRVLQALSPFYSPRKAKEPRMHRAYVAAVEAERP